MARTKKADLIQAEKTKLRTHIKCLQAEVRQAGKKIPYRIIQADAIVTQEWKAALGRALSSPLVLVCPKTGTAAKLRERIDRLETLKATLV